MTSIENQRDYVCGHLDALTPKEWLGVAVDAKVDLRTIYNVMDPKRNPTYNTVFSLYSVLKTREAAKKSQRGRK